MERRLGAAMDRRKLRESPRSAPSTLSVEVRSRMAAAPSNGGGGMRRKGGNATTSPTSVVATAHVESRGDGHHTSGLPRRPDDVSSRGIGGSAGGALIILRKIAHALLTNLDDEAMRRDDTERIYIYITLIKEAMIGLLVAIGLVSFVLFVDHRFILGLPTARNFRRATFQLMNDNVTLPKLEEAAGIKFLELEQYHAMRAEIAKAANRTKLGESIFEQRDSDLQQWKKDLAVYIGQLPELVKELELKDYCERCLWNLEDSPTCTHLNQALTGKFQTGQLMSMMMGAKQRSCEKVEARLLEQWNKTDNDFCGECAWQLASKPKKKKKGQKKQKKKKFISCSAKANDLNEEGIRLTRAKIRVMLEKPRCRASVRAEELRMHRFCHKCMWDDDTWCRERATELMAEKDYSAKKAVLTTMDERAACEKNATAAEAPKASPRIVREMEKEQQTGRFGVAKEALSRERQAAEELRMRYDKGKGEEKATKESGEEKEGTADDRSAAKESEEEEEAEEEKEAKDIHRQTVGKESADPSRKKESED
ncbi:hypothetical protein ACHAXT_001488 [Thalassiosira profunda]